ncbi:PAS domain S-box-containing protein [Nocardia tenerifensis]|uniref:PAS domain S-box-containing protein n=1 Tax=Nocardia tenerifensis TaxID=228006 RepID=A0A318K282_9NOCA|nr:PAS and ANTAR domain-containing protein [Nocardia tenerifensis]PXX61785.1 PAS domain S-box-containing protein [Nocardia tenerifensis]
MEESRDPTGQAQHHLAGAGGPGFGSFRFWFATQRWEWSPEVYRMHGYAPGEVEPTTELILAHKHPDDRDQVTEQITRSVSEGRPFSSRHRFLDTQGNTHHVIVVSDRILDATDAVVGTAGYYVALDETLASAEREALDAVLPEVVESRAVIEQAKGVLMRMYSINAEQAFKVLSWRSQETNVKLRDLAEALIGALPQVPPAQPSTVTAFDHVLLTIHERIHSSSD